MTNNRKWGKWRRSRTERRRNGACIICMCRMCARVRDTLRGKVARGPHLVPDPGRARPFPSDYKATTAPLPPNTRSAIRSYSFALTMWLLILAGECDSRGKGRKIFTGCLKSAYNLSSTPCDGTPRSVYDTCDYPRVCASYRETVNFVREKWILLSSTLQDLDGIICEKLKNFRFFQFTSTMQIYYIRISVIYIRQYLDAFYEEYTGKSHFYILWRK